MTNWTFQWKMIFNPDLGKAEEVIFSGPIKKLFHSTLLCNNVLLSRLCQRHLGLTMKLQNKQEQHVRKFNTTCPTQLTGGALLKMQKYFEVMLKILKPPARKKGSIQISLCK